MRCENRFVKEVKKRIFKLCEIIFFLLQYHWADGNQVKKPIKCSAPKYIDFLMTWVQDQLDDEALFPSKIGVPFPNNFLTNAKTILKRLFRVYAHVYHQHFKVLKPFFYWSNSPRPNSEIALQIKI